jgi:flagellar motility protein MotE (MotC chaperone)
MAHLRLLKDLACHIINPVFKAQPGIACLMKFLLSLFSMFSSYSSQRLRDTSILLTNSAVPSTSSTTVQEVSSPAKNQTQTSGLHHKAVASDRRIHSRDFGPEKQAETADHQNQTEALERQNEANTSEVKNQEETSDCQKQVQASGHQNQVQASDFLTKQKNLPKNLEEIRKAADAAAEELEKLEKLRQSTKEDLQRLKLAHEQAREELARTQKQLVEAVGVQKIGQVCVLSP